MAGRRATGPRQVTFAQMAKVKDTAVQRALEVINAGVLELQTRVHDTFTSSTPGYVPSPGGVSSSYFLSADGTWRIPSGGGGGVTSVTAGSTKVSVSPTTGAVVVDVVPANFTGIPESGVTSLVSDLAAKAPTARLINTTAPLAGGGDLTADRTLSISANGIDNTLIRQGAALSVIGRSANSLGNVADIAAGTDAHVLRRSGTTLGFGTLVTASIADSQITYAKIQNVSATSRILGRVTAGAGVVEELTGAQVTGILAGTLLMGTDRFGFGYHGSLHFDGSSTVLGIAPVNAPANYVNYNNVYILTGEVHATDITVDAGVYVITANHRVFATGTLTNNGFIGNPGIEKSSQAAHSGSITAAFYGASVQGGGGTGTPGNNGTGGTASGAAIPSWTTAAAGNATVTGQGGSGGSAGAFTGGTGGAITITATEGLDFDNLYRGRQGSTLSGSVFTWGSGGGSGGLSNVGAGSQAAGGGGSSGGMTYVGAQKIAGSGGRFSSKGGDAGNATGTGSFPGGGGGGGGGGVLLVAYGTNASTCTFDAAGGAAGTGINGGNNGTAGHAGSVYLVNMSADGT